jgi:hypothetical protein
MDLNGVMLTHSNSQQHQSYFTSGHTNKEMMELGYSANGSSMVQDRAQFEADKQAVYRLVIVSLL